MNSIGYEVCQQFSTNDVDFRENEMCLRQMAEDMKYYGVEPNMTQSNCITSSHQQAVLLVLQNYTEIQITASVILSFDALNIT